MHYKNSLYYCEMHYYRVLQTYYNQQGTFLSQTLYLTNPTCFSFLDYLLVVFIGIPEDGQEGRNL
jgi:hypothetical protein